MKYLFIKINLIFSLLFISGCANTDPAVGAALGAVIGGTIGNEFGKGRGKKVARVVGAVAGGMIGYQLSKSAAEKHNNATNKALASRSPSTQRWTDKNENGYVKTSAIDSSGCRSFYQEVRLASGEIKKTPGKACQSANGWVLV